MYRNNFCFSAALFRFHNHVIYATKVSALTAKTWHRPNSLMKKGFHLPC